MPKTPSNAQVPQEVAAEARAAARAGMRAWSPVAAGAHPVTAKGEGPLTTVEVFGE
jgi:hypothetical protein